jgi:hypothetical protein
MTQSEANREDFVRVQIVHEWQPDSNPYPGEIEVALKKLNLPEVGSISLTEQETEQGVIRHETGPEIIVLVTAVVSLATAIIELVNTARKNRPETKVQITVSSPKQLQRVLQILGNQ